VFYSFRVLASQVASEKKCYVIVVVSHHAKDLTCRKLKYYICMLLCLDYSVGFYTSEQLASIL